MATITVTTINDEENTGATIATPGGTGLSLREAIELANSTVAEDTIIFDSTVFATDSLIRLTLGELDIEEDLIIDGSSASGDIVITGDALGNDQLFAGTNITDVSASFGGVLNAADDLLSDNSRVFDINTFFGLGDVTFIGLTITGGRSTEFSSIFGPNTGGGGIQVSGDLTLIDSNVSGNSTFGGSADGGGIDSSDDLRLINTTISHNSTSGFQARGGGAFVSDNVILVNSTIANNSTAGDGSDGGGLVAFENITAIHTTVTGNSTAGTGADGGGLIAADNIELINSIVLGNVANQSIGDEVIASPTFDSDMMNEIVFDGFNIVGRDAAAFDASSSFRVSNANPVSVFAETEQTLVDTNADGVGETSVGVLGGVLRDNGGPVFTVALLESGANPALDTSSSAFLTEFVGGADFNNDGDQSDTFNTDARGLPRSFDVQSTGIDFSGLSDLGAFEFQINQVTGTNAAETLNGNAGPDTINALAGNDTLNAFNGNDILRGGLGADILNGGDGFDTADYADSNESVFINLFGNPNFGGTAFGDTLISIENIMGSNFNDIIGGNQESNVLNGGNGSDQLTGFGGNDTIDGGDGIDIIQGVSGDNTLIGGEGGDIIFGGTGIDIINGDAGADTLFGDGSNDTLNGGAGDDALVGGVGDDTLNGGGDNDFIIGNEGADVINGGEGNDTTFAGADNDTINGDAGDDALVGEGGNDVIDGGTGFDFLSGGAGVDTLNGGADNDLIAGGLDGDTLNGDAGDDVIFGEAGNDTINGGSGTDFLIGDAGNDTFIFEMGGGDDLLLDFENNLDTLDLTDFNFASISAALDFAVEDSGNVFFNFSTGDTLNVFGVTEAQLVGDILV